MTLAHHMSYHALFNDKAIEFLSEMATLHPQVDDFRTFRSGMGMLCAMDPRGPQRVFSAMVAAKYRQQILAKDEAFFLRQTDFGIDALDGSSDHWETVIEQIKHLWRGMTPADKDAVWRYLGVLLILCDKCNGAARV